ncbi:hypothetical protein JQR84_24255 (plasmid) [Pseudomonas luteola]|uniref:hypothetical protein n=1 Tax=Pseudomonas TaxID=286 RepID=UPI003DA0040A
MKPSAQLSRPIMEVLLELRKSAALAEYSKIESDEFINVPEAGIFFHAQDVDVVTGYRVYYQSVGKFFPAQDELKEELSTLTTLADAKALLGEPAKTIRSFQLPGIEPTFPGLLFTQSARTISIYHKPDDDLVSYVHVKLIRN